ncbi:hypothetical protein PSCICF_48650 [Pseudomonas cichorii]|nr:hypothetical protein PSCICF_48650 [Pseudomonas cichorii]
MSQQSPSDGLMDQTQDTAPQCKTPQPPDLAIEVSLYNAVFEPDQPNWKRAVLLLKARLPLLRVSAA